jgi:hypothetical protein
MSGGLAVTPPFFEVLKIPVVQGRTFRPQESNDVAIINAALASRLWPNASVLGRRIRVYEQAPWLTVIGVVSDVEMRLDISNQRTPLQIYTPLDVVAAGARPAPAPRARRMFVSRRLVVRAPDPAALVPALKREVWTLDKALPVQQIERLQDVWNQHSRRTVPGGGTGGAVALARSLYDHRARGRRTLNRLGDAATRPPRDDAPRTVGIAVVRAVPPAVSNLTALLEEPYDAVSSWRCPPASCLWRRRLASSRAMAIDPTTALRAGVDTATESR